MRGHDPRKAASLLPPPAHSCWYRWLTPLVLSDLSTLSHLYVSPPKLGAYIHIFHSSGCQEALGMLWPVRMPKSELILKCYSCVRKARMCLKSLPPFGCFSTEKPYCPCAWATTTSQPHCTKLLASGVIFFFSLWVSDEAESHTSWCSQ